MLKGGIQTVIRRNEEGLVYGMTYIDYKNKVVFNGSDLGKEYSAKGMIERMAQKMIKKPEVSLLQRSRSNDTLLPKKNQLQDLAGEKEKNSNLEKAIELVMKPVNDSGYVPYQLKQKKRKKKKISLNL